MTATGYAAMIKAANLMGVGERALQIYLSAAPSVLVDEALIFSVTVT
jgi:hypothetical protein